MAVDSALVRELAELLGETGLTEIEVEDGDRRIRVARNVSVAAAPAVTHAAAPAPVAAAAPAAAAPAAPAAATGTPVKSPMVGTAFLSSEPGSAPFVNVGDTVKAGETLLIVEAMKVMNPITAPTAGTIQAVLVGNGDPVEFDQPLVIFA
jgi:acetyl-CoA carboxylase biotin carboxyl carrier protein